MDGARTLWLLPAVIVGIGVAVVYLGGGWVLAVVAAAGLAITLWPFLLPVHYEVSSLGIRRRVFNRLRFVPWHAIRAYQLRPTGVVLYQRSDPSGVDLLRSIFIPYPADADELLVAMRQYASHAVELPQ
jgi:hypothetical protein